MPFMGSDAPVGYELHWEPGRGAWATIESFDAQHGDLIRVANWLQYHLPVIVQEYNVDKCLAYYDWADLFDLTPITLVQARLTDPGAPTRPEEMRVQVWALRADPDLGDPVILVRPSRLGGAEIALCRTGFIRAAHGHLNIVETDRETVIETVRQHLSVTGEEVTLTLGLEGSPALRRAMKNERVHRGAQKVAALEPGQVRKVAYSGIRRRLGRVAPSPNSRAGRHSTRTAQIAAVDARLDWSIKPTAIAATILVDDFRSKDEAPADLLWRHMVESGIVDDMGLSRVIFPDGQERFDHRLVVTCMPDLIGDEDILAWLEHSVERLDWHDATRTRRA